MKKNKPKKYTKSTVMPLLKEYELNSLLEKAGIIELGIALNRARQRGGLPAINTTEGDYSERPFNFQIREPKLKSRTPVRDYLRLIAIVLVVALGAHFALKKMSGPPKGALYQISSGPGRTWTDYAIAKPTLTASGCVVWFDLDNLGNIFCGEFVISDVPGRVVHE